MYRHFVLVCILIANLAASTSAASVALLATPLEIDTLGLSAALIVLTLIQLIIAGTYLFRFKKNHLLPGIATIVALVASFLFFVLYTLDLLSADLFNTDNFFPSPIFSNNAIDALSLANGYFSYWTDPFTVYAVVLVVRDRCKTYFRTRSSASEAATTSSIFNVFFGVSTFLAIANFIFGTVSISLDVEADDELQSGFILDLDDAQHKAFLSEDFLFVQQTVNSLMILLLIPFTFMARRCMPNDKILNLVMFGIAPILFFRFIGGCILLRYTRQFELLSVNAADAVTLASLVIPGFSYFLVFCILCYILLKVNVWLGPGEDSVHVIPNAQFPGQWGYFQPELPQMQQPVYPQMHHPVQQSVTHRPPGITV